MVRNCGELLLGEGCCPRTVAHRTIWCGSPHCRGGLAGVEGQVGAGRGRRREWEEAGPSRSWSQPCPPPLAWKGSHQLPPFLSSPFNDGVDLGLTVE